MKNKTLAEGQIVDLKFRRTRQLGLRPLLRATPANKVLGFGRLIENIISAESRIVTLDTVVFDNLAFFCYYRLRPLLRFGV